MNWTRWTLRPPPPPAPPIPVEPAPSLDERFRHWMRELWGGRPPVNDLQAAADAEFEQRKRDGQEALARQLAEGAGLALPITRPGTMRWR